MALTYNQLQTVTREHFRPQLIDQVFKATPVLDRMKKANRLRPKGGDEIHFPVISAKNTFVQKIVKDEVFSTNRADKLTKGVVSWREYVVPITIAKTDLQLNGGSEEKLLDLLDAEMKIANKSLADTMATDLQAAGGSNAIDGFGAFLQSSGTYAGIASTDLSDWAANIHTLSVAGTLSLFEIQKLIGKCTDGTDRPTLLFARQSVFDRVWTLLQADQRFAPVKDGNAGFETLHVSGVPLMVDQYVDGSNGGTQDNHLRCINEKYIHMAIGPGGDFEIEEVPNLKDQRVFMQRIYWMGNIYCDKLKVQGEIQTIDPDLD